jgi:hypothetical protein
MKFEWYSLMCTPCLERLRAADFARDKHGRATEDLWDILCANCFDVFNEWCAAQNTDCACEED